MLLEDIRKDGQSCQEQQRLEGRWVKREHCSEECTPESVRAPGAEGKSMSVRSEPAEIPTDVRSDRRDARGGKSLKSYHEV